MFRSEHVLLAVALTLNVGWFVWYEILMGALQLIPLANGLVVVLTCATIQPAGVRR
jgi:hypothetical protein